MNTFFFLQLVSVEEVTPVKYGPYITIPMF